MSRFLVVIVLLASFLAGVSSASAQDKSTPSASPDIGIILLTAEQVPPLEMIMDGERSLDDIVANFTDSETTTIQFEEWGWKTNVVRAFHAPDDADLDGSEIDGIYISVHELGSPSSAIDALDYTFATHIRGTELDEVEVNDLGQYARELYGHLDYGNEVTYYVQVGNLMIRFSASSPEGDPRTEARELLETMLATVPSEH